MGVNNGARVAASKPKVGGGIYWAKRGTAQPTDASTPLAAAYVCLGPISEGGVKPSRDTKTDKIKEWDGSTLANLLTEESRGFEFLMYGVLDKDVNGFVFGEANVTVTPATSTSGTKISIVDKGGKPEFGVLVIEMMHGGKKMRKVVPLADPTITGEEDYVPGKLRGYTCEVEATKDAAGAFVYEYAEDDDKLAA